MNTTSVPENGFNASSIASLSRSARARAMRRLTEADARLLEYEWSFWARPAQLMPPGDWRICVWLAGRGWGKTRTGAEAVRTLKETHGRIALVAPTAADARDGPDARDLPRAPCRVAVALAPRPPAGRARLVGDLVVVRRAGGPRN